MKILVIGHPRSGTSLTNRIFREHPEVKKMIFEKNILKDKLFHKKLPSKYNCGEKVTYTKDILLKGNSTTVIDYCLKWTKEFGEQARIIQPIRHPYDVWNSMLKHSVHRKKEDYIIDKYDKYFNVLLKNVNLINSLSNSFTFKYENLIMNKNKVTKQLYSFCDLSEYEYKEKMKSKRVFAYKRTGFKLYDHKDFKTLIEFYNKFEGPVYS